jgi:glycosyltransferase 2 family protein
MTVPSGRAAWIGRLLGWSAVALSFGFIGLQLWQHAPWHLAVERLQPLAVAVVIGALVYGTAGLFLSSAWCQLMDPSLSTASTRSHHAVYGRTQIAKYLPGNLFHLVGRQVMGGRLGYGQARLALASLLEAVLLVVIAGTLALPIVWRLLDGTLLWIIGGAGLGLVLLVPGSHRARTPLAAYLARAARAYPDATLPTARRLLCVAALYAGFFLVVAVIFWILTLTVTDHRQPPIGLGVGVSVIALAWLAGFVTPGSSAGIGVREAILIAALEGSLDAEASTLIALALRLVSLCGDAVFFAIAVLLSPSLWPSRPDLTAIYLHKPK